MLSAADVEGMRATVDESLPDTCALVADTSSSDGAGGHIATPGAPVNVACRVSPMRLTRSSALAEVEEVERIVEQSLWLTTMPHGTSISPEQRFTHAGRLFEIVEVLTPRTWNLGVRATAKLVNSGAG